MSNINITKKHKGNWFTRKWLKCLMAKRTTESKIPLDLDAPIKSICSESYYLGQLAGEIIEFRYLPTLEVDTIKTLNVIPVSSDELIENTRLHNILTNSYIFNGGDGFDKGPHKNWSEHTNHLASIHLPETIKCKITKINPTDMDSFKEGLNDYLWDTYLSWYTVTDGFFIPNMEHTWCSIIMLTRDNSISK